MNTEQRQQTAVAVRSNAPIGDRKNLQNLLEKQRGELVKALAGAVREDYFIRVALTAFNKQPLLFSCTAESLMVQLLDLASLKLTANGIVGEAWLVPFRNNQKNIYEATLIIGYKGYVKLMRRSNDVSNLHADIVTMDDHFELEYGSKRRLVHRPTTDKPRNDMSRWLGAYAFIQYTNGGEDFVYLDRDRIEKVQSKSKSGSSGPWKDWPDSMWAKTAVRQLKNLVSLSPETEETLDRAQQFDSDGSIDVEATVAPTPAPSGLIQRPSEVPPAEQETKPAPRKATRRRAAPAAGQPEAEQGQPASGQPEPSEPLTNDPPPPEAPGQEGDDQDELFGGAM